MTARRLSIGKVQLGRVPRVVLVVDSDYATLSSARKNGVHLLEARIDRFKQTDSSFILKQLKALRKYNLPVLATVRSKSEGGRAKLTAAQRLIIYKQILPLIDAIDVELSSLPSLASIIPQARKKKKTIIISYHNFKKTPSEKELMLKLKKAFSKGADIFKCAVQANTANDVLRMYEFTLKHSQRGLVTLSMGNTGSISRIVFPSAGSLLSYTSPILFDGQIPLQQLVQSFKCLFPKFK